MGVIAMWRLSGGQQTSHLTTLASVNRNNEQPDQSEGQLRLHEQHEEGAEGQETERERVGQVRGSDRNIDISMKYCVQLGQRKDSPDSKTSQTSEKIEQRFGHIVIGFLHN